MTLLTMSERLDDCIQRLARDVLGEVEGLSEDEKNVHYLCRSIENLVRLYAEGAMLPQKRLAHQRLNRHLERLKPTLNNEGFGRRSVDVRPASLVPIEPPVIGRTERKRRRALR